VRPGLQASSLQTASAQITIKIPEIPKVKKPKQSEPPRQEQPTAPTTDSQPRQPATNEAGSRQPATQGAEEPSSLRYFVSEINKAKNRYWCSLGNGELPLNYRTEER